jgi:hypothetical protein
MTMTTKQLLSLVVWLMLVAATSATDDVPACVCGDEQQCEQVVAERVQQTEERLTAILQGKETEWQQALEELLAKKESEMQGRVAELEANFAATFAQAEEARQVVAAQLQESLQREEAHKQETHEALKREEAYKQETQDLLASLEKEIGDLMAHKIKASELEEHVQTLKETFESHQSALEDKAHQLTKEVDTHKGLLEQTNVKHRQVQQELKLAKDRMEYLHHQATTTYMNTTLMYQDACIVTAQAKDKLLEAWEATQEAAAPLVEATMQIVAPILTQARELFQEHVAPQVAALWLQIQALYKEHAKETVDKDILPALKPILEPIQKYAAKGYVTASVGLEQVCESAHFYLESSEAQEWLVSSFGYCRSNGSTVINNTLWGFLALLVLRMIWPKKKPAKPDHWMNAPTETKKQVKFANGGWGTKKKKVKSQ